jgi:hypothetical protein
MWLKSVDPHGKVLFTCSGNMHIFEKLKKTCLYMIIATVCPNIAPLHNYIKMTEAPVKKWNEV